MSKREQRLLYLSLGSNIDPDNYIPRALYLLRERCHVLSVSSIWASPAVESGGPDFLNAAVCVETESSPEEFKSKVIRPLEAELGRVRGTDKFAPRTIDIDIILDGKQVLDTDLWRFAHLAVPIAEVYEAELTSPDEQILQQVAEDLKANTAITKNKSGR